MKTLIVMMACACLIQAAQARESRQEALQTCAREAQVKELTGDAYAEFMRACLKPPAGYKPPVFDAAQPQHQPQALPPALRQAVPGGASTKP